MPSKPLLGMLIDIRDNAALALDWVQGHDLKTFSRDKMLVYAVTRCLEIVSEASRRLPPSFRERHSTLPWRAIMDSGNFYRHEYDNVTVEAVFKTVQQRLPELIAMCETEIAVLDTAT